MLPPKILYLATASLIIQLASACNSAYMLTDLCNGEVCGFNSQCNSGNCPSNIGKCMPSLTMVIVIVVGSIILCIGAITLCCCFCCRSKNITYNQTLLKHDAEYYDPNGNMRAAPKPGAYQ